MAILSKKLYCFNPRTKTLHIRGGCVHSGGIDYEQYATEQEAYAEQGRQIKFCKNCERKREEILKRELSKKL